MQNLKFLNDLLRLVEQVNLADNNSKPEKNQQDNESFVGVLPDDLKKLWIVKKQLHEEIAGKIGASQERLDKVLQSGTITDLHSKELDFAHRFSLTIKRYELTTAIFWQGVMEAFPEISLAHTARGCNEEIGIRKGWQVVTFSNLPDSTESFESFLELFMVCNKQRPHNLQNPSDN